jgi:AraC-type DNA-binding domain-containing proteins
MIYHFPPPVADSNDHSFLVVDNTFFAKYKKENKTTLRNVFITENVLVFVLEGYKHLHIDDETIEVTPQEIVFLRKGIYAMAEYFEEKGHFEAILLFLNSKILQEVINEYGIKSSQKFSPIPFLKIKTNPVIDSYKRQLRHFFTERLLRDKDILLLKQKEILLYLFKTIPYSQTSQFWNSVIATSSENLSYFVEEYLFQKLSLKDFATLTNRSLSTFKRDFKRIYHSSPQKWMNQKRLEYSRVLLRNTRQSISEISEKCGFESLSYFTRLFKRTFHQTPSEFRAEMEKV